MLATRTLILTTISKTVVSVADPANPSQPSLNLRPVSSEGGAADPIPTSRPKLPTAQQASSETEIRLRLQLLSIRVQQKPALFL